MASEICVWASQTTRELRRVDPLITIPKSPTLDKMQMCLAQRRATVAK